VDVELVCPAINELSGRCDPRYRPVKTAHTSLTQIPAVFNLSLAKKREREGLPTIRPQPADSIHEKTMSVASAVCWFWMCSDTGAFATRICLTTD